MPISNENPHPHTPIILNLPADIADSALKLLDAADLAYSESRSNSTENITTDQTQNETVD